MDDITLREIYNCVLLIAGIGGPFLAIYSWYKRKIEDRIDKLEARLEKLEKSNVTQFEELTILLKGQLACLQGLKEQGCNGPVTQAIDDINDVKPFERYRALSFFELVQRGKPLDDRVHLFGFVNNNIAVIIPVFLTA